MNYRETCFIIEFILKKIEREIDGGLEQSSVLTHPHTYECMSPYRASTSSAEPMADLKKIEREIPHHMNSE